MKNIPFFHPAWSPSSQIDYVLVNDNNRVLKYNKDEKSSINLSAHTSVTVKITIEIPARTKPVNKNNKSKVQTLMGSNRQKSIQQPDSTVME